MIKCKLQKLSNNKNAMRTDEVAGFTGEWPPKKGTQFVIVAPPLEAGSFRIVATSEVQNVAEINDTICQFTTKNSWYRLVKL